MKKFNSTVKIGSIIFTKSVNDEDDNKLKVVLKILSPITIYNNFNKTVTEQQDVLVYDSTKVFIESLFADMDTVC